VRNQLIKEVTHMQNKALANGQLWPPVATLPERHRKRILVTGGAGFVGSNLVDRLMMEGHEVIVLDNMFTGRKKNVQHWIGHPSFQMIVGDVVNPVYVEVDQIYHLACPASPPHYQYNPIKTIKTSTEGTLNMLGLAKRVKARILLTSTYVPFVSFFFFFFHISFVGLSLRFFLRSAVSQPLTTYLPPLKK
jgi:hypothetical protein